MRIGERGPDVLYLFPWRETRQRQRERRCLIQSGFVERSFAMITYASPSRPMVFSPDDVQLVLEVRYDNGIASDRALRYQLSGFAEWKNCRRLVSVCSPLFRASSRGFVDGNRVANYWNQLEEYYGTEGTAKKIHGLIILTCRSRASMLLVTTYQMQVLLLGKKFGQFRNGIFRDQQGWQRGLEADWFQL